MSRTAALLTGSLASVLLLLGTPLPAGAVVHPVDLPCLTRQQSPTAEVLRRGPDTPPLTPADLAAAADLPAAPSATGRSDLRARADTTEAALPDRVYIKVDIHVIRGTHAGERFRAGPRRMHTLVRHLNKGFRNDETLNAPATRFRFRLRHIDWHRNDAWFHASLFSKTDRQAKRALHTGGKRRLNLYIGGGGSKRQPVLGWSRFPWQHSRHPRLDGVSINNIALPGGSARHYREGDTVIHETGHWMGLLHTFEGGCEAPGDQVEDTPPEAYASFACPKGRNTCPEPGDDPIHNFMDYSFDGCMHAFTPGQITRMDAEWAKWRRG